MAITDTHIHIWDLAKVKYQWLEGNTTILNKTYSLEELEPQRKATGITAGVLVQAANNFEDTDLMLEAAAAHPWIKGVVGWFPLLDPDATLKAIDRYKDQPLLKGIRHLIHDERNTKWLLQERVVESLKILATHGYSYDVVGTQLDHLKCVITLGMEVPELNMVLDHLNQPPILGKAFGEWGVLMEEVAQNPRVHAKISGLGLATKMEEWNADHLRPAISFALATFGADRCFCGGDWPVALLAGEYQYTWDQYQIVINTLLKHDDRQKVYELNAARFYRF